MAVSCSPLSASSSSSSAVALIQNPRISVSLFARPTLVALSVVSASFLGSSLSLRDTIPREGRGWSGGGRALRVTRMSMEAGVGVMGTKLGMMSFFQPDGTVVPITVVGFREGNIVTQVKTAATDGYDAVQIGYRRIRERKLTRPELGHLQKAGAIPMRHLQEFRLESVDGFEPGQRLLVEDLFKEGDLVDVSGKSIGKGFQGKTSSSLN